MAARRLPQLSALLASMTLLAATQAQAALVQYDPTYAGITKPINISTATTTQLVALSAGKGIYVTHWDVIAGGTGNGTWVYGDDANCVTNQVALTGPYNLAAQVGGSFGDGVGAVLVIPRGKALCFISSAAVQYSGSFTYIQN